MNTPMMDPQPANNASEFAGNTPEVEGLEPPAVFPFSDVVGLDDAKLALLLCTIEPAIGGVLLRGEKGSGKTTLARGLADLLGPATPFVNLPLGASEDRVVGTLDLGAALTSNDFKFSPGLFSDANGGVLYVDEVNLLADHIVDTLLDVAVSGINRVEREGISHTHGADFVLVGSMNPEEGELRPQLLDRFGLCVDIAASREIDQRVEAVMRRLRFSSAAADAGPAMPIDDLQQQLFDATPASLDADVIKFCCELAIHFDVEGLRTDLVLAYTSAALAGFEGRAITVLSDVQRVASLVLAHRGRKTMFDSAYRPADQINQMVNDLEQRGPDLADDQDLPEDQDLSEEEFLPVEDCSGNHGPDNSGGSVSQDHSHASDSDPEEPIDDGDETETSHDTNDEDSPLETDELDPGETTLDPAAPEGLAPRIPARAPSVLDSASDTPPLPPSSSREPSTNPEALFVRGRNIGDLPFDPTTTNPIAVAATVRNLAKRRSVDPATKLKASDLRRAVRKSVRSKLLIFAVDTSGSMGAENRSEAAAGAIRTLLADAYQNRSQVALVTFKDNGADLALSPTSSVEVANLRLGNMSTGGTTPLGAGIEKALSIAQDRRYADRDRSIILLTDGRATGEPDAMERAEAAAETARDSDIPFVVLDCETSLPRLRLAEKLATTINASYVQLEAVTSKSIASAVTSSAAETKKKSV